MMGVFYIDLCGYLARRTVNLQMVMSRRVAGVIRGVWHMLRCG